ncbi:hypothetical protein F442_17030 [Phytophthora nicotianae P10297]|uniref:Cytochrome b5 heme-binding domain-containing protein n=1 Tax=Phytophthora nicotianae P10297 TaxID=1317064 RepID=W2YIC4_PHYNI|nr:hypothetical protein F442_17030 [Phytophthora nicotianae P10297]
MAGLGRFFLFGVALVVAIVALAWPQIEQQLIASGYSCPYPFSILITGKGAEKEAAAEAEGLPKYTLDQLRMYDGSDEEKPILLAVGGKVLDVTSGAKFYAKGKSYNQFAGTACTRALALGSLKKERRRLGLQRQEKEGTRRNQGVLLREVPYRRRAGLILQISAATNAETLHHFGRTLCL